MLYIYVEIGTLIFEFGFIMFPTLSFDSLQSEYRESSSLLSNLDINNTNQHTLSSMKFIKKQQNVTELSRFITCPTHENPKWSPKLVCCQNNNDPTL